MPKRIRFAGNIKNNRVIMMHEMILFDLDGTLVDSGALL